MSNSFNPFEALGNSGCRDPRKLLKKSKRKQNASNHSCLSPSSTQLTACTERSGNSSSSDDQPISPGLAEALAAVQRAEEADRGQWGVSNAARSLDWSTPPRSNSSALPSPSCSFYSAVSSTELDDDPWHLPPSILGQQQRHQLLAGQQQRQQQQHKHSPQRHQQKQSSSHNGSPDLSPGPPPAAAQDMLEASALAWQCFAVEFADDARAAGDFEAAEGAVWFDEGDSADSAAGFLLLDPAAVAAMAAAAEQAEAAGLSAMDIIKAQQNALLHEATTASGSRAGRFNMQSKEAAQSVSAFAAAAAAVIEPEESFPALRSSSNFHRSASSPLHAGKSPHSIPKGWRGGRSAPKAKGIRVINSSSNSSRTEEDSCNLRPTRLDLHWDLTLDGLRLKQDDEYDLGVQGFTADAQAAAATRLLAQQQAAAADMDRASCRRDRLSQDTIWSMMEKAGRGTAATAANDNGESSTAAGSRHCGRDWGQLFSYARATGWVPVDAKDGGGGKHWKWRRTLPLSGKVQTFVVASSPSDSLRSVRNAASALVKKDKEMQELEAAARAAAAEVRGDPGSCSKTPRSKGR